MLRKKHCSRCAPKRGSGIGYFFIAMGTGLFFAYAIPRYILITILGLCLIGGGICMIVKK